MNINSDDTTIIFKNIPKQIDDVANLLQTLKIPAKEIKPFGRKRVLIKYELKNEAEHALAIMKELEFTGKPVNVSLFCKDKPKENIKETTIFITKKLNKSVQTSKETTEHSNALTRQEIDKYVQKLYAIEGDLGFDQPPPPYLKYTYPPINKDIMDNICISLLSNKRFYTQVLHLMNRMNLEPPFIKREYKFTPPGIPLETGTQTENDFTISQENKSAEMEEIESELESSGDERNCSRHQIQIKRKLPPQPEQYKKKAKQILHTTQKLNKESLKRPATSNLSLNEIFEKPDRSSAVNQKIELQLKRPQKPTQIAKTVLNLPADLSTQKLPALQLDSLPIYKNYQKGQASNKLYIKNLHKDVTDEDLKLIYKRFLTNLNVNLDIKVMQHGRMKGQAFVTFLGDDDTSENIRMIATQALEETNGFILRDKPMVVCYGKQS